MVLSIRTKSTKWSVFLFDMTCLRLLALICVAVNIWKLVSSDYPCICNYHVELTVSDKPGDKGALIGYMYEFDCKPQAFVEDLDSKWLAVAFEKKLGYVQKDEQVQIQKCPGNQPEEDKLPITTTASTIPSTTTTQSTVPTTTSTTTTQSTVPTTTSTTTTQSTVPTTTSTTTTQSTVPTTTSTTTTQSTVPTTTSTTTTQSTLPTTTSTTTTQSTVPTTTATTTTQTTVSTTTSTTTTQSTVPTTTSTTTTQSTVPTAAQSTVPNSPSTTTLNQAIPCMSMLPNVLKNPEKANPCDSVAGPKTTYGHFCYELEMKQKVNWCLAELHCRLRGGNLLSISSAAEDQLIYNMLLSGLVSEPVWMGLNDHLLEENFLWSSGESISFDGIFNWKADRKSVDHNNEDCVSLERTSNHTVADDINCNVTHGFICKYPKYTITASSDASSTTKPTTREVNSGCNTECHSRNGGQVRTIQNHCVEFVNETMNRIQAMAACKQFCNGNLAEIRRWDKENDKLTLMIHHPIQFPWGGNYSGSYCITITHDNWWKLPTCDPVLYSEPSVLNIPFICVHELGNHINLIPSMLMG